MKKINIAMAGGGTGGHVFPIKSLIQHIYKHDKYSQNIVKIIRFGEKDSLEQENFQDISYNQSRDNLYFQPIISGKYRRETLFKSRLKNIRDAFKFLFGIFQSLYYLQRYHIDVIFCKGGYVALPIVLAGKMFGKKILVHESDVKPGLVNKIAAKYADDVFTGFDEVLPGSVTVGQILSDDIVSTQSIKNIPNQSSYKIGDKLSIAEKLYYTDSAKTHLLVVGGSQGSKRLYQNLLESINSNKHIYQKYEIFVVLGKENSQDKDIKQGFDAYQNIHVFDFVTQQEMGLLLKNCDIALTRAGTTSLAEQKLYNLKIVTVPIPRTHDQYDNAKFYVNKYKDILLDSKSETYKQDLLNIFQKYNSFKKQSSNQVKDILSEISIAKDTIVDAMIG